MKLNKSQYTELVEKFAGEVDTMLSKQAEAETEGEGKLTEDQVKAILEAKKQEIAEKKEAEDKEKCEDSEDEMEAKAAAVYEYAMNKIATCQAFYSDGVLGQQSCLEVLAQAGILGVDGIDKEAAESSDDAVTLMETVAGVYDDCQEKIAAAEECYAEAVQEAGAAMEVLAAFGYEFN